MVWFVRLGRPVYSTGHIGFARNSFPFRLTGYPIRTQPASLPFGILRERVWMLLRKEVIQPLVPQRLPCYDFIPVTNRTLGVYLPCGSNQRLRVQSAPMM